MADDRHPPVPYDASHEQLLLDQLERSREFGFLGPGDVGVHIDNARLFSRLLREDLVAGTVAARRPREDVSQVLDLGSGGGVPGLVIAWDLPQIRMTLCDAMEKRCRFLRDAVTSLGIQDRVEVLCGRAEVLAHSPTWRNRFASVVARSFGPSAVTAECAAGFLAEGGRLYVSEPPAPVPGRWPADGLAALGLELGDQAVDDEVRIQVLRRIGPVPDRYPRRDGIPAKRPLF